MTIPDHWIQAVLDAEETWMAGEGAGVPFSRADYARHLLEAVVPLVRAHTANQIADAIEEFRRESHPNTGRWGTRQYKAGLTNGAAIARRVGRGQW